MDFLATLVGWAAIIVMLAAPLIIGAILFYAAIGGIAAFGAGRPALGVALLAGAAASGFGGIHFLGPSQGKGATMTVAQPRAYWRKPLPRLLVLGDSEARLAAYYVRPGGMRVVLAPPVPYGRPQRWTDAREARIKAGKPECAAVLADLKTLRERFDCVESVPVALPETGPDEPYVTIEQSHERYPVETETARFVLVSGSIRQPIVTCSAEYPSGGHPLLGWLAIRPRGEITRAFGACKRRAAAEMAGMIDRR